MRAIHSGRVDSEEVSGERQDVRSTRAQGRHLEREDAQAIEQVLAKLACADLLLEVAIGGSYDANVHFSRAVIADAFKLRVLQNTQQLGLKVEGDFAYFV
jgi:hypothetical protein